MINQCVGFDGVVLLLDRRNFPRADYIPAFISPKMTNQYVCLMREQVELMHSSSLLIGVQVCFLHTASLILTHRLLVSSYSLSLVKLFRKISSLVKRPRQITQE